LQAIAQLGDEYIANRMSIVDDVDATKSMMILDPNSLEKSALLRTELQIDSVDGSR